MEINGNKFDLTEILGTNELNLLTEEEREKRADAQFNALLAESIENSKKVFSEIVPPDKLEDFVQKLHSSNRHKFELRCKHVEYGDLTDDFDYGYTRECVKFYKPLDKLNFVHYFARTNLPNKYFEARWDFKPSNLTETEQKYFSEILETVKNRITETFLIDDSKAVGMFLYGDLGVGKSSLLGLIAKRLLKCLDVRIYYCTSSEYLQAYTDQDHDKRETIKEAQILLLDAFGQESYTEGRVGAMLELFHHRYSNSDRLITFIASNFDPKVWSDSTVVDSQSSMRRQIADYCNDSSFIKKLHFRGKSKRC